MINEITNLLYNIAQFTFFLSVIYIITVFIKYIFLAGFILSTKKIFIIIVDGLNLSVDKKFDLYGFAISLAYFITYLIK